MGSEEGTREASVHGVERSPHWAHVRDQFLKAHPKCAGCGATDGVEVHHVVPFHICVEVGRGYAELDARNLIALCRSGRNCHQLLGHLDDFKSYCLSVKTFLSHFKALVDDAAIKADPSWQSHHLHRPRFEPYKVTDHEKAAITHYIDTHYPIHAEAGQL